MDKYILIYKDSDGKMSVVSDDGFPLLFDSRSKAHKYYTDNMVVSSIGETMMIFMDVSNK